MLTNTKSTYLLFLLGTPVLWVAQMSLSQIVVSNACYPHEKPLAEPLWRDIPNLLAGLNIACLVIALSIGIRSFTSWQQIRKNISKKQIASESRVQFIAIMTFMTNVLFIVAILFTACANLLVSPCTKW